MPVTAITEDVSLSQILRSCDSPKTPLPVGIAAQITKETALTAGSLKNSARPMAAIGMMISLMKESTETARRLCFKEEKLISKPTANRAIGAADPARVCNVELRTLGIGKPVAEMNMPIIEPIMMGFFSMFIPVFLKIFMTLIPELPVASRANKATGINPRSNARLANIP